MAGNAAGSDAASADYVKRMPTRALLTERAKWYTEGCPGLEDGTYESSGDLATDAGKDLSAALEFSAQNEAVATEMLKDAEVYQARADLNKSTSAQRRIYEHAAGQLRKWADMLRTGTPE